MAHPNIIMDCLQEFAANWGRGRDFIESVRKQWLRAFERTPNHVLEQGLGNLIRDPQGGSFIPPLSKLIEYCGMEGEVVKRPKLQKCADCFQDGRVRCAWHWVRHGRPGVTTYLCRCTCQLGESLPGGSYLDLHRSASERSDYVDFFHTSLGLPALSPEHLRPIPLED